MSKDRSKFSIGFSRKGDCKSLLVNNFIENEDYKVEKTAPANSGAVLNLSEEGKNLGGSGLNKENVLLTIRCFKKLLSKFNLPKDNKMFINFNKMFINFYKT
jgi:hypothetical protein